VGFGGISYMAGWGLSLCGHNVGYKGGRGW
jgi:hypothetical protein